MTGLNAAKAILARHGIHAKKSLGQNFLVDPDVLQRIARAAEIGDADTVIEIGPGLGILTNELAARAGRVIAIEIDARMIAILRESLVERTNVEIVEADILETDVAALAGGPYKVVANLPYYITSPVLRKLLESDPAPTRIVVMVQKEVAERIVAKPGRLSLLAVSVQVYGTPTIVGEVAPRCFFPMPDVASAILRIDVHPTPLITPDEREHFFKVVAAGFSQPRKMLHNTLAQRLWFPPGGAAVALDAAGIASDRRAQTVSIAEWIRLAGQIGQRP